MDVHDLDGLYELDSDEDVHEFLGKKPVIDKVQVMENINSFKRQYLDNGTARLAIIDKATGNFIGWSGLKWITESTNSHIHYYDLGYRIIKRYWGLGLATETAIASLHYAFKTLKANEVYAMADCGNVASNRILLKVGLRYIEQFNHYNVPHNWYMIKKEDFILNTF